MSKEMREAFRILEEDKGIKKEDIIEAVTESLRSAYRRRYGQAESAAIEFNEKTGDFRVYTVREVVDEVFDMPWQLIQLMSWEIRSSLKKLLLNLAGLQRNQLNKRSWKKCASKHAPSLIIPIKSMKMKL